MVDVLILEDESYTLRFIKKLVQENPLVYRVFEAQNSEEALNYIRKFSPSIALLDIELSSNEELNGVEIAKIIKNIKPDINFIFITGYSKYAIDSFSVHPYDYILKPVNVVKFMKVLNSLINQIVKNNKTDKIVVKNKKEIFFIPLDTVLFIEKQNKDTIIHVRDKEYLSKQTLNELENKLPKNFLRVHKSYIVNKDKITRITNIGNRSFEIRFSNTSKIALMSRYKFEELKEKIIPEV
ncbi:LytR/AlgR family response regulator transcription factor [Caloranaerobacter ferrireducens]|uniref:LytR/AlgR family response regulator transcription factor n=1 Tax=Caloranaerobacter ferrireducens TaxID=1323370 RepID=UPI00084D716D|nr:LytTR family DNA-binding domain-containing protein [Caloranaerobacter ferrireducens]